MNISKIEQRRYRLDAIHDFEQERIKAWWSRLWAVISRRDHKLLPFGPLAQYLPRQHVQRGLREIPLDRIVGSVNRDHEFTRNFFPLRDTLRERWVSVQMVAQTTGWPPIQVYQVGNLYFVEDGHHRVSVARRLGNPVIEAEVWEYPVDVIFDPDASLAEILDELQRQTAPQVDRLAEPAICGAGC